MVEVTGLPSVSVPEEVWVMVLPSLEMTVRPVTWYLPPVFFTSQLVVFASIRLTEMVSNDAPVTGYSLPSEVTSSGNPGNGQGSQAGQRSISRRQRLSVPAPVSSLSA